MMQGEKELEDAIQSLILEICEVMYNRGYRQIRVGPLMRLIGVSDEDAQQHDEEFFVLDNEFLACLEKKTKQPWVAAVPKNTVLH